MTLDQYLLSEAKQLAHRHDNVSEWWAAYLNWSHGHGLNLLINAAVEELGAPTANNLECLHSALRGKS